jgi:hypothetical protein
MITRPPTHHGVPFRTSTHSTDDCVAVAVPFRTSTYSNNDCVAVAVAPATVALADTKTRHAEVVEVALAAWVAFIEHIRH